MLDLEKGKFTYIRAEKEKFIATLLLDRGAEGQIKIEIEIPEEPADAILEAFADMRQDVIALCELEGKVTEEQLEVRSVAMDHKKGNLGVVISAVRKLERSSSPLNLHTPHKVAEPTGEGEGDPKRHLTEDQETRLRTLIRESKAYVEEHGDGPQMDAFSQQEGEPKPRRRRTRQTNQETESPATAGEGEASEETIKAEAEIQTESAADGTEPSAVSAEAVDETNVGDVGENVGDEAAAVTSWLREHLNSLTELERSNILPRLQTVDSWEDFKNVAGRYGFRAKRIDYESLDELFASRGRILSERRRRNVEGEVASPEPGEVQPETEAVLVNA